MAKDLIDKILDFVNGLNRDVIPIIGTPGSGKTFFLASLTKWVLQKVQKPELVFLEGREYLFDLAVRHASIEIDPSTHYITKPLIEPNVPTENIEGDLQKVLLRIPDDQALLGGKSFDLFTIDGPGEIIIKHPEILAAMTKNLKGLILLVDVVGNNRFANEIDWSMVTNNALSSVHALSTVVEDELQEHTPIALVVTKWDRLLLWNGFKDEKNRRKKWDALKTRLTNIYLPLIRQHKADVFFHSSIGVYSNFEEALKAGETLFPFPDGLDPILKHLVSDDN